MEKRTITVLKTKGGNGGDSFRASLPTAWIRDMQLDGDYRKIEIEFNGSTITIKKVEEKNTDEKE